MAFVRLTKPSKPQSRTTARRPFSAPVKSSPSAAPVGFESQGFGQAPIMRDSLGAPIDVGVADRHIRQSPGHPMDDGLARDLTNQLGQAVGGVVVHRDAAASKAAAAVNARAFSVNNHIFFGSNGYVPTSDEGNRILAHEAAHVLQYQRGDLMTRHGNRLSSPGETLEQEADRAARGLPIASNSTLWHPTRGGGSLSTAPIMRFVCPTDKKKDPKPADTIDEDWKPSVEDDRIDAIKTCLKEMGIPEERPKWPHDYSNTISWSEEKVTMALASLDKMNDNVVDLWMKGKDDLKHYPNILTYVMRLEELSQSSMDSTYAEASAAMPMVTVAGARVPVHPMAVYFAAAAQVAMDVESDFELGPGEDVKSQQGVGHYVAPGAFAKVIQTIYTDLMTIKNGKPQVKQKGKPKPPPAPIAGSKAAHDIMIHELQYMCDAVQVQEGETVKGITSHQYGEHHEPALRAFLAARRAKIEAYGEATDDADAQQRAVQILMDLDPSGGKKLTISGLKKNTTWSLDLHATDHAMGWAIDLFKSKDSFGNAGFKDQLDVYRILIAKYWKETEDPPFYTDKGFAPLDPSQPLHAFTSLSHGQARSLHLLAQLHADDIKNMSKADIPAPYAVRYEKGVAIAIDPDPEKWTKDDKKFIANKREKAIRAYSHQAQSAYFGFSVRAAALGKLLNNDASVIAMGEPLTTGVRTETEALLDAKATAESIGPSVLISTLGGHIATLNALVGKAAERHPEAIAEAFAGNVHELQQIHAQEQEWATTDAGAGEYLAKKQELQELEAAHEIEEKMMSGLKGADLAKAKKDLAAWEEEHNYATIKSDWKSYKKKNAKVHKQGAVYDDRREDQAKGHARWLGKIDSAFEAIPDVGPEMGTRNLVEIKLAIEDMFEQALWAHEHILQRRLEQMPLKLWAQSMTDPDRGLYDQPEVMVRALESLKTNDPNEEPNETPMVPGDVDVDHIKSGHHFEFSSLEEDKPDSWNILADPNDYETALEQDMNYRLKTGPDTLERIMEVMAESEGGRKVLFGHEIPQRLGITLTKPFERAAKGFAKAASDVLTVGVFQGLRDDVYARVVAPYIDGNMPDDHERSLKDSMRKRGYYL